MAINEPPKKYVYCYHSTYSPQLLFLYPHRNYAEIFSVVTCTYRSSFTTVVINRSAGSNLGPRESRKSKTMYKSKYNKKKITIEEANETLLKSGWVLSFREEKE